MPFIYDKENRIAVDKERNISIRRGAGLWGDTNPPIHKFVYTNYDFSFEFGAVSHSEQRKLVNNKGKEVIWPVDIAMDVLEGSIKTGIGCSNSKPVHPLSPQAFEELKADIQEGMFVLCSPRRLEDNSPLVPEFKISFVNHVDFILRTSTSRNSSDVN